MRKLFPSQLADERIYLVVRQHWVTLALKILVWMLFVAALILFQSLGGATCPNYLRAVWGK